MNIITKFGDYIQSLKINELIETRIWAPLVTFFQAGSSLEFLRNLVYLAVILCACGIVARLFLGKASGFSQAMIACQSIQFTYLIIIFLYLLLPALRTQIYPMPFTTVTKDQFQLWELMNAPNEVLADGMVQLAALSLIVNVLEEHLPKAKKLLPWFMWRVVSATLSIAVYSFLFLVMNAAFADLPKWVGLLVVLGFWALVILVGIARGLMNVAMASVPKFVDSLYTFFYSRDKDKDKDKGPGKVLTKSIFSAIAFLMVVLVMNRESIGVFLFTGLPLLSFFAAGLVVLVTMLLFVNVF